MKKNNSKQIPLIFTCILRILSYLWWLMINMIYFLFHPITYIFGILKIPLIVFGTGYAVYMSFFYGCHDMDSAITTVKLNISIYSANNQLILIIVGITLGVIMGYFLLNFLSEPVGVIDEHIQNLTWSASDYIKNNRCRRKKSKTCSLTAIEEFKRTTNYYINVLINRFGVSYARNNIKTYIHPAIYDKKPVVISFMPDNNR